VSNMTEQGGEDTDSDADDHNSGSPPKVSTDDTRKAPPAGLHWRNICWAAHGLGRVPSAQVTATHWAA